MNTNPIIYQYLITNFIFSPLVCARLTLCIQLYEMTLYYYQNTNTKTSHTRNSTKCTIPIEYQYKHYSSLLPLQFVPEFLTKCIQLYEMTVVRHGMMLGLTRILGIPL